MGTSVERTADLPIRSALPAALPASPLPGEPSADLRFSGLSTMNQEKAADLQIRSALPTPELREQR